ncbi:helix-turn-helix domain-containing protein [Carnobacterium divergens]|uniref:Mga helix-turn-helix domain-containing protein n=1 Tax=Carnobacterium divergens TaxID=2748 RepID=A0A7Z8G6I1_CARDV|nr:helix-turn-helix domain-containing protein [Carnobacterium divergens]TFI74460.1 hypothetical protein CKN58_04340 [Carnobacterium divergens]TFI78782.1 hypothetical protein CKN85_04335 [Carnobacterium divergens]TFI85341.1 hypothetical protein CKN56_04310 [Carnobacterium divergens]TFI97697.1 hypothetical protein CKN64_04310 [Carnobacterium divergens]TFJ13957.1 hypothetical protein CKN60_04380 [Carnobacterium divergens]
MNFLFDNITLRKIKIIRNLYYSKNQTLSKKKLAELIPNCSLKTILATIKYLETDEILKAENLLFKISVTGREIKAFFPINFSIDQVVNAYIVKSLDFKILTSFFEGTFYSVKQFSTKNFYSFSVINKRVSFLNQKFNKEIYLNKVCPANVEGNTLAILTFYASLYSMVGYNNQLLTRPLLDQIERDIRAESDELGISINRISYSEMQYISYLMAIIKTESKDENYFQVVKNSLLNVNDSHNNESETSCKNDIQQYQILNSFFEDSIKNQELSFKQESGPNEYYKLINLLLSEFEAYFQFQFSDTEKKNSQKKIMELINNKNYGRGKLLFQSLLRNNGKGKESLIIMPDFFKIWIGKNSVYQMLEKLKIDATDFYLILRETTSFRIVKKKLYINTELGSDYNQLLGEKMLTLELSKYIEITTFWDDTVDLVVSDRVIPTKIPIKIIPTKPNEEELCLFREELSLFINK